MVLFILTSKTKDVKSLTLNMAFKKGDATLFINMVFALFLLLFYNGFSSVKACETRSESKQSTILAQESKELEEADEGDSYDAEEEEGGQIEDEDNQEEAEEGAY